MLALPEIKHIIAIASGKGGVGKSTVAVNLALALQQQQQQVGLLDADIYGPSLPLMLGATDIKPEQNAVQKLLPVERYGLQTMSMGYLVAQNTAMIWRGPMASTALQQLIRDTAWQALDYLIIDLPPGTGDIQLTLAQKIPVTGALIQGRFLPLERIARFLFVQSIDSYRRVVQSCRTSYYSGR